MPMLMPIATAGRSLGGDATLPVTRHSPSRDPLPFVAENEVARRRPEPPPLLPTTPKVIAQTPPADFPIERCASVAAALAMSSSDRESILEASGLTRQAWAAIERRWSAAIRKEGERGKTALLTAYDEAYIAELERGRGPIEAAQYARLMLAMERGSAAQTLDELKLPRDAQMRIQRVMMKRITKDKNLAASVREALLVARGA
jgi:hypothetical protein